MISTKSISSYTITVTFSDGATQAFQAATNNPSSIYLPVATSTPTAPTSPAPAPTPTPAPSSTPVASPTPTAVLGSGQLVSVAADPAGGGGGLGGFGRNHWITSVNKMLSIFGYGPANGDNSIRLYDPVANTWQYVFRGDVTNAPQVRDNHYSLYVDALDEYWIWGGSHLETLPSLGITPYPGGRFGPFANNPRWITKGADLGDSGSTAFTSVVDMSGSGGRMPTTGTDPATAWNATLNMGIICCGSSQGNPQNDVYVIEPKTGGPQPYKSRKINNVPFHPRQQMENGATSCGRKFYIFAGEYGLGDYVYASTGDLWEFNPAGNSGVGSFTRLADPSLYYVAGPDPLYQATVMCDANANRIVVQTQDKIFSYDIATNIWSDTTPSGMPCVFNSMGVYAPTTKTFLIQGGVYCQTQSGTYQTWNVNLSGNGVTIPQPSPTPTATPTLTAIATTPTPTPLPSPPPATSTATPTPTPTPTLVPQGSGFNISPRSWLAIPYSSVPASAPGNGGSGGTYGGKHMNLAMNTDNGKMYITGGDSAGIQTGDNQGVWSYHIPTNTWQMEYPHCGFAGDIMPGGANESGFVYVAQQKNFVLQPGFWFLNQSGPSGCGGQITWANTATPLVITGKAYWVIDNAQTGKWYENLGFTIQQNTPSAGQQTLTKSGVNAQGQTLPSEVNLWYQPPGSAYQLTQDLVFDPGNTQKWSTSPSWPCRTDHTGGCAVAQAPKNAAYDPVTQKIFRVGTDGRGVAWYVYDLSAWPTITTYSFAAYVPNGGDMQFEWTDIDIVGRKIYVMDPHHYDLWELDIPAAQSCREKDNCSGAWRKRAKPPTPPYGPCTFSGSLQDFTQVAWDPINRVLLYPWICSLADSRPKLFVYHPDTDTWETDPMFQPEGRLVRGNHFKFDTVNNVLLSWGGLCRADGVPECSGAGNNDPSLTHFFIYRYGNGK